MGVFLPRVFVQPQRERRVFLLEKTVFFFERADFLAERVFVSSLPNKGKCPFFLLLKLLLAVSSSASMIDVIIYHQRMHYGLWKQMKCNASRRVINYSNCCSHFHIHHL